MLCRHLLNVLIFIYKYNDIYNTTRVQINGNLIELENWEIDD